MYKYFFKRIIDLVLSIIGIVLMSPLILFVAIRIKRFDNGPIYYLGKRIGKGYKPFYIRKFRTMVVDADKVGPSSTSEKDPRITPIGHFIRKYKIDEVPQLFNVFLGQMSFVGPRPDTEDMVNLYTDEEKEILSVRPGITDFASIVFRNEGGIIKAHQEDGEDADATYLRVIAPDKHRLNLQYINDCSLFTDFKLILATAGSVFRVEPEWVLPEEEKAFSKKINFNL